MLRIIRGRCKGKTYDLIKYAIKNDCAVICITQGACKHHMDMAEREFGKHIECYTLEDWKRYSKGRRNKKCVIDEMELLMKSAVGGELMGWNMSIE